MELRELAERILFGNTLEAKLAGEREVTDECPGVAIRSPTMPGRPRELVFKEGRVGSPEAPPTRVVQGDRERGRLLHFFANHELLATELMALVLLRFPDAPASFRRGVHQTLRDEQAHTRLYLDRMRDCGVSFGEYPVSGYFWRAVAPMQSPLDYVAGLSLTFEQANLDFCRHFAKGFSEVGDAETSRLLDGIYRDEIAHVAYGLKWFRRWKEPGMRDWEAFCQHLRFPLTPQRAKGMGWNAEGRRAAGLDAQFIEELRVYAASRGRTPVVYWFNPFAEGYWSRGRGFTPVRAQAQLARDLANLPQYLARRDDLVLVPERPASSFLAGIQDAGFALPEFIATGEPALSDLGGVVALALRDRKLGGLRPWAWGPEAVEALGPLVSQVTGEHRSLEQRVPPGRARLYSKAWSAAFLARLLRDGVGRDLPGVPADEDWLCRPEEVGVEAHSLPDALEVVSAIRARGHHRVVVKQSLGLAGGNAVRLWEPEITPTQRLWLERAVAGGRSVVVEPWLERGLEISVHFEMAGTRLRLVGYSGLTTDARGGYLGNTFAPGWDRR
ncbi:MAG: DUF455 family protein, partial [Verrucomicrobiales bacterium]|nr:DUF455 family protein [Verrucomicrobiales bacterium]